MALEFGGLGSALFAGMREFERQEDRETIQKDRELAKKEREEDRAYQRQQREYQAAQQKRTLAEQTREDQFREGIAGVRTTDQISEAAVGTVYGQDAPVMRDDDGNLMPGAVETKPAQTTSRQRNKDDIMAEYAEIARKAGKLDQALKFDEQAAAESMKRGKALFSQWSASTPDDGNLEQAIKQATQIYNGDRLPGQVQGYKMNPDGSATVDIKNTATGQAVPVTFKNVAELKQGLEGYYSPETLDAYRKSLREARIKAQEKIAEERAKPVTTPAGAVTTFGAGDPRGTVSNDTGYVWTGRLNADGSREMVKPGKYSRAGGADGGGDGDGDGTGSGGGKKKGKTPLDVATSSVMDAIKESAESKTLNADQLIGVQATARELVANAARNNQQLDPYVAGRIALTSVLKPDSVKPSYNPATGTFENTVSYNGNTFSVGKVDQAMMPESQLKGVAQAFVNKLPAASRAEYIQAASGDKAALDKIRSDIAAAHGKQWSDQFAAVNGRRPTQQDIQASIARTQAVVDQNIQLVGVSGAVEQDKKQRETASRNQAAADAKAAIGTPAQIMALPPGKAAEIYRQYGAQTDGFQREALQRKMQQDRTNMSVGGMRQQ